MRTWPACLLLSGPILSIESERDGSVTQDRNGWLATGWCPQLVPTRVNSTWQSNSSHTPISYTLHLFLTALHTFHRHSWQKWKTYEVKKGADSTCSHSKGCIMTPAFNPEWFIPDPPRFTFHSLISQCPFEYTKIQKRFDWGGVILTKYHSHIKRRCIAFLVYFKCEYNSTDIPILGRNWSKSKML